MNARLLWQLIGATVVVVVLVAGWFVVVQPVLAAIAADRDSLATVEAQNALIAEDIQAMTEIDLGELESEVRGLTTQLPHAFDEAAVYREVERIVSRAGAQLSRVAVTAPTAFVGAPSTAVLPDDLVPANTPEALTAAAEAGLVVATAAIEFDADTPEQALAVIEGLSAADRIYLVTSGAIADAATQRVVAELYFLPRSPADIAVIEGR